MTPRGPEPLGHRFPATVTLDVPIGPVHWRISSFIGIPAVLQAPEYFYADRVSYSKTE